jgi:hypothetical protein
MTWRSSGAHLRGEFGRAPGGAFEQIVTEVHASGTLDEELAGSLIERAERLRYVHNTLRDRFG